MKNLLHLLETRNFRTFYYLWSFLFFAYISVFAILIFLPTAVATVGSTIVYLKPVILTDALKPAIVESLKSHITIVLSVASGVFVFLTNACSAFSRMPGDNLSAERFRNAAYAFLFATILMLLGLGTYFLFGSNIFKFNNIITTNVTSLLLSFVCISLYSFAVGMAYISRFYFDRLWNVMKPFKPETTVFTPLAGNEKIMLPFSLLYWIVVWIFIGTIISNIITVARGYNILAITGAISIALINIQAYFNNEHGNWKARIFSIFGISLIIYPSIKILFS